MTGQIFAYCERGMDPGFWAEPVNAATNLAFAVAGAAAMVLAAKRLPPGDRLLPMALAALVFAIGTGSFLFHTLATRWAAIADVIPIWLFMLAYFAVAMRRLVGLTPVWTAAAVAVFILALWGAPQLPCPVGGIGRGCLNGSMGYVPALLAMLSIGGWLIAAGRAGGHTILAAAGVFAVSLTCRIFDRTLCPYTVVAGAPLGTHFLWHLLNALTLYLLLRAVIAAAACSAASTPGRRAVQA